MARELLVFPPRGTPHTGDIVSALGSWSSMLNGTALARLEGFVSFTEHGALGDGSTNARAEIAAADAKGRSLYAGFGSYLVSSNITIASPLYMDYGAILKPASGVVITLNHLDGTPTQHVDESLGGTVTFSSTAPQWEVLAEWWGAQGNDSTDSTTAWTSAYTAAKACFAQMPLLGIYKMTGGLTADGFVSLIGKGRTNRKCGFKKYTNSFNALTISLDGGEMTEYKGFAIWNDASNAADILGGIVVNNGSRAGLALRDLHIHDMGGHGLLLESCGLDVFENITITSCGGDGLKIAPTAGNNVNTNTFHNIDTRGNGGIGFHVTTNGGTTPLANFATKIITQSNTGNGFKITEGIANEFRIYAEANTGTDINISSANAIRTVLRILNADSIGDVIDNGLDSDIDDRANGLHGVSSNIAPYPAASGAGRDFQITGGKAADGIGGTLLVQGGQALGTDRNGGALRVLGGEPTGTGRFGYIAIAPTGGQIAIGAETPSASCLVELVSTTGAVCINSMTTAQRDALTAKNGMIIYNSDAVAGGQFEKREGGAWVVW